MLVAFAPAPTQRTRVQVCIGYPGEEVDHAGCSWVIMVIPLSLGHPRADRPASSARAGCTRHYQIGSETLGWRRSAFHRLLQRLHVGAGLREVDVVGAAHPDGAVVGQQALDPGQVLVAERSE